MKKVILLFIAFLIVGCPPVVENGDNNNTDTTATDSIPVDTIPADTTITDSTITDIIDTGIVITDTSTVKEIKNKYETALNKEKKRSYFQLFWECPVCNAKRYTDSNIKMDGDYQKLDRKCLNCFAEFKIKRKKDFYECKPK